MAQGQLLLQKAEEAVSAARELIVEEVGGADGLTTRGAVEIDWVEAASLEPLEEFLGCPPLSPFLPHIFSDLHTSVPGSSLLFWSSSCHLRQCTSPRQLPATHQGKQPLPLLFLGVITLSNHLNPSNHRWVQTVYLDDHAPDCRDASRAANHRIDLLLAGNSPPRPPASLRCLAYLLCCGGATASANEMSSEVRSKFPAQWNADTNW